jgi:hypothetical protein
MQVPEREHFVVSEVCSLFRCNEATLRRWRRRGIGPKPFILMAWGEEHITSALMASF